MKLSKISAALLALALSGSTLAATFTLDYRHEYRDKYAQNFDRLCVIGTFENNVGFYVDSSYHSWGKDAYGTEGYHEGQWGDFGTSATEMSVWWKYQVAGSGWSLTPGLAAESNSESTGWKHYLRVQYNFADSGLWLALRPRFDYWRFDEDGKGDQKNGRVDAWVGYNCGNFGINYNYTYMRALNDHADGSERHMYNGKSWNYEHNIALNYRMGQFNPYVEIGNIAADGTADKSGRQTRARAGFQYTF